MAVDSRLDRQHHVDNDHEDHNRKVMVDKFWRANELCSQVQACAGATEIVEGLRKLNIPMAIATSSRMDSVNKKKKITRKCFVRFNILSVVMIPV